MVTECHGITALDHYDSDTNSYTTYVYDDCPKGRNSFFFDTPFLTLSVLRRRKTISATWSRDNNHGHARGSCCGVIEKIKATVWTKNKWFRHGDEWPWHWPIHVVFSFWVASKAPGVSLLGSSPLFFYMFLNFAFIIECFVTELSSPNAHPAGFKVVAEIYLPYSPCASSL